MFGTKFENKRKTWILDIIVKLAKLYDFNFSAAAYWSVCYSLLQFANFSAETWSLSYSLFCRYMFYAL